jgi:hypothetical protein
MVVAYKHEPFTDFSVEANKLAFASSSLFAGFTETILSSVVIFSPPIING